jgi:hypothetical protein
LAERGSKGRHGNRELGRVYVGEKEIKWKGDEESRKREKGRWNRRDADFGGG